MSRLTTPVPDDHPEAEGLERAWTEFCEAETQTPGLPREFLVHLCRPLTVQIALISSVQHTLNPSSGQDRQIFAIPTNATPQRVDTQAVLW